MDEDDYSWVGRTRFSHSVVRSSSGREKLGDFDDQFDRWVALKQRAFSSELKIPAHVLQPRAKVVAASNPARPSIPKAPSAALADRKPKDVFLDGQLKQQGVISDDSLKETSVKQDREVEPVGNSLGRTTEDGSSEMLEFSFHSEEQSIRLQRVCSSPGPSPFFAKDATLAGDPNVRSVSFKVAGDGSQPKRRAKSPIPGVSSPTFLGRQKLPARGSPQVQPLQAARCLPSHKLSRYPSKHGPSCA